MGLDVLFSIFGLFDFRFLIFCLFGVLIFWVLDFFMLLFFPMLFHMFFSVFLSNTLLNRCSNYITIGGLTYKALIKFNEQI